MMNDGGHPHSIAPLRQSATAPIRLTQYPVPHALETKKDPSFLDSKSVENDIIIDSSSERYNLSSLCKKHRMGLSHWVVIITGSVNFSLEMDSLCADHEESLC